ncbi:MAG: hypothetical protein JW913_03520 [Chitinispirillaceae bacterium]|nr:hypothetical protein [Chitinispirillaceae bacterium]
MNVDSLVDRLLLRFPAGVAYREERIKRLFLSICISLMIPVTIVFGIRDLFTSRVHEAFVVFGIGIALSSLTFLLNRSRAYFRTIRFFILCLTLELFYLLYIGGGKGAALLWFYVMPSSMIFLLGFREGIVWVGCQIVVMSVIMFGKFGTVYQQDLAIRFIAVFTVVTLLACSLEILRERYLKQLLAEKEAMQKALDEIRVLKGMVPICASCKKIRDDKGFWTQIEAYMKNHADIEFSHGICPECAAKLFPTSTIAKQSKPVRQAGR